MCSMYYLLISYYCSQIRDSSVGIGTGYGLNDQGIAVRFPAVARDVSLLHSVQTRSGAHPASYQMSNGGSFPGRETDHSPLSIAAVGVTPPLPRMYSWRGV
jgi:hypothetical protein